jgi:hypothetical protein
MRFFVKLCNTKPWWKRANPARASSFVFQGVCLSELIAVIDQLCTYSQNDPLVLHQIEEMRTVAARILPDDEKQDLWFLLHLFGDWIPGIMFFMPEQTKKKAINQMQRSLKEIDEVTHIAQALGRDGYLVLLTAIKSWFEGSISPRRQRSNVSSWTGQGVVMLVKHLDGTQVLPPALLEWAQRDFFREICALQRLLMD